MKNACKHFALCTLTLILCLALAACGSDNSGDSADYGNDSTVPSTIDGFVKESYDSYDYSAFEGYYLPDSGTDFDYLIIDTNGSRWRIGNNDDLAASGYLQYDADYDCIYAYKQALENAKATPDMSAEELCDLMIEQFTTMTFDGLTGEGMTWDETGAVSKSPKGMVIANGAYVGMD